ncbi:DUF6221 family protein [Rhodococcus sp. NPDC003318]|uniref:DUF6221 family protein n=1 Tax=Rhodococcus sp. NPDC003318 TaxID=3364503 RepID=UPI00367A87D2
MTIVEFLLERIDDDEEIALAAAGWDSSGRVRDAGLWHREGVNSVTNSWGRTVVHGDGTPPEDSQAEHIVHNDPARVLRECAAKREILEHHRPVDAGLSQSNACYGCGTAGPCGDYIAEDISDCPVLTSLAAVYSDHPDYDPTWSA